MATAIVTPLECRAFRGSTMIRFLPTSDHFKDWTKFTRGCHGSEG